MDISHPQYFFRCAGGNSCYFDCITKIAADLMGVPRTAGFMGRAVDEAADAGFIYMDGGDFSNPANFTVVNPPGILLRMTGARFSVRKEPRGYVPAKGEIEVDFWALSEEDGARGKGHFCMPGYDPLVDSVTRRNGFIYSKRIFRRLP